MCQSCDVITTTCSRDTYDVIRQRREWPGPVASVTAATFGTRPQFLQGRIPRSGAATGRQFAVDASPIDAEQPRRLGDVAIGLRERPLDQCLLGSLDAKRQIGVAGRRFRRRAWRNGNLEEMQVPLLDALSTAFDKGALDDVL